MFSRKLNVCWGSAEHNQKHVHQENNLELKKLQGLSQWLVISSAP